MKEVGGYGREILPSHVKDFYIKARRETYASGAKPQQFFPFEGFFQFEYTEEDSIYLYRDVFTDFITTGNFSGMEIIRRGDLKQPIAVYTYGGGLTNLGFSYGEDKIYEKLKEFLKDNADVVRFGNSSVSREIKSDDGTWHYQSYGWKRDWGWEDREEIKTRDGLLYQLNGTGAVFMNGF